MSFKTSKIIDSIMSFIFIIIFSIGIVNTGINNIISITTMVFLTIPLYLFIYSILSLILFSIKQEESTSGIIKEIHLETSKDESGSIAFTYFLYIHGDNREFDINYYKERRKLYRDYSINSLMNPNINIKYKKIFHKYIVVDVDYLCT